MHGSFACDNSVIIFAVIAQRPINSRGQTGIGVRRRRRCAHERLSRYPEKAMIPAGESRIRPRFVRRGYTHAGDGDRGEIADANAMCTGPLRHALLASANATHYDASSARLLPVLLLDAFKRRSCRYLSRYPERRGQRLRYFPSIHSLQM